MDVLRDDALVAKSFEYIRTKPKFFTGNDVQNLKSFLRNSASWVRKVANFPPKSAREIYNRYVGEEKLVCLDTSMGFGSRLSGAVLSGHSYIGFDPNKKLFDKLVEYSSFLEDHGFIKGKITMYNCGSETFCKDLVGVADVSFTSPPYFNLEKYSDDGCASTENYGDYDAWVEYFVIPTVKNTVKYLKTGGYAMINIKNLGKRQPCYDSFYQAFVDCGMTHHETFDLNISKKQYGMANENQKGVIVPKEPIMCFRKE